MAKKRLTARRRLIRLAWQTRLDGRVDTGQMAAWSRGRYSAFRHAINVLKDDRIH